jgi:hypothetical protein
MYIGGFVYMYDILFCERANTFVFKNEMKFQPQKMKTFLISLTVKIFQQIPQENRFFSQK